MSDTWVQAARLQLNQTSENAMDAAQADPLRYGIVLAPWGEYADPNVLARLAHEAETATWDGVFLWDAMLHDPERLPKADPWIALAAIAMRTERLRIGTLVTPLPRRRPWKLAREVTTLDHLSGGRMILGVGLGDPSDEEFQWFGEPGVDHRTRARMLDEGLAILDGLWRGGPFGFEGEFYRLHEMTFTPRPLQRPRVPIWVGGWWPSRIPFRRAARWDGAVPGRLDRPLSPDDVRDLVQYVREHRSGEEHFDVVVAEPSGDDRPAVRERVGAFAEAGATWWLEKGGAQPADAIRAKVLQGPPR
jgi:alkanesulfonate monooxygenase SsuD/methylene tetrahydromethanopterin reductase-like flavin-dependent oxidoreductase (luciferase family)